MARGAVRVCTPPLIAVLVLSGCESFNLRPPAVEGMVTGNTEAEVVTSASRIMTTYSDLAGDLSVERNYFNIPLLGMAATAAGALVFGGGQPQSNILKGTGLGAATVTATQTYLAPGDRMTEYARGSDAVACVIDSGSALAQGDQPDSSGKTPRDKLDDAFSRLDKALSRSNIVNQSAPNTTSDQIAAFKDAQSAATAARDSVKLELAALNSSVSDTKAALRSIITKVRSVVLTARSVDFSATRDALVLSAKQSADAQTKKDAMGAPTPPPTGLVEAAPAPGPPTITGSTAELRDATGRAGAALIHEFAQQQEKLTGCPAKAG